MGTSERMSDRGGACEGKAVGLWGPRGTGGGSWLVPASFSVWVVLNMVGRMKKGSEAVVTMKMVY